MKNNRKQAVALVSDSNYLEYAAYLGQKVVKFDENIHVYIGTDGVDGHEFNSYFKQSTSIKQIIFDEVLNDFNFFESSRHVSRASYIKLLLPKFLPSWVDTILYLDIDILLKEDIEPLLAYPLNQTIAGTQFVNGEAEELFGHSNSPYFSAGVLLIDRDKWITEGRTEQCLAIAEARNSPLKYQDMDVLNLAFQDQWQILPPSFNYMNWEDLNVGKSAKFVKPIIIHFPGPTKPWTGLSLDTNSELWRRDFIRMGYQLPSGTDKRRSVFLLKGMNNLSALRFLWRHLFPKKVKERIKKYIRKTQP